MKKLILFILCTLMLLVVLSSCSEREIKQNREIPVQKETTQFIIKSENTDYADEIANNLEKYYSLFEENYDLAIENKLKITIYSDNNKFSEVIPKDATNKYIYYDTTNGIMVTIPKNENDRKLLINDICYCSLYLTLKKINPDISMNVAGGISNYELYGNGVIKKVSEVIPELLKKSTFPSSFSEFDSMSNEDMNSAYISYTLIEYIVNKYGYDKLNNWIKTTDTKQVFNLTEDEFYSIWIAYLKTVYPALDKTVETEHFTMNYNEVDEEYTADILKTLEDNYSKLTTNMQTELTEKCPVKLYPSHEALLKINSTNIKPVAFAEKVSGTIYITSPSQYTSTLTSYPEAMQTVVHELVHILTYNMCDELPTYLMEGIAEYESNHSSSVPIVIGYSLNNAKGLSLPKNMEELENMLSDYNQGVVYQYGYTAVEYIIEKYGRDALINLIKANGDITVLERDGDSFYTGWIEFLKENYQ